MAEDIAYLEWEKPREDRFPDDDLANRTHDLTRSAFHSGVRHGVASQQAQSDYWKRGYDSTFKELARAENQLAERDREVERLKNELMAIGRHALKVEAVVEAAQEALARLESDAH